MRVLVCACDRRVCTGGRQRSEASTNVLRQSLGLRGREERSVAQQMNWISSGVWWLFILGRGEVMSSER